MSQKEIKKEVIKQTESPRLQEAPKPKSALDMFFKLGDYVTRGDPQKQQDFTYYMLAILFLAFTTMFISNLYLFVTTWTVSYIIWALVGFAISSLQFFNLKSFHEMRKARKSLPPMKPGDEHKVEDVDEMLEGFKKKKDEDKKEDEDKKNE